MSVFVFLSPAFSAEPQGRIISADIRPGVIQAGSRFNVRLSAQNTGAAAWQAYGLRVRLYNSKKKLVKFPSGADFAYGVIAPWPAGLANSIDAPIIVPGLAEFMSGSLVSGVYYYVPELFASLTASGPSDLFRRNPVHRGTLKEVRIYNPSLYKSNLAVTAVWVSSVSASGAPAAARVRLKNFGNANSSNLVLKLFADDALVGERTVELLPAQQEKEVDFDGAAFPGPEKAWRLRAVLVAADDYPEDNSISVEVAPGRVPPP